METLTAYRAEDALLRRAGGLSAIALGVSYVAITGLYVVSGVLPAGAEEQLRHVAEHTTVWWMILGLSVATDLLFLPFMWSLYAVLRDVNKNAMLAGTGLVGLFVLLDLAVTWPNYSTLITLGDKYVAAGDDAQRAVLLGAATYAVEVLSSGLFAVYAILVPAMGCFVIGWVMLKGAFGKIAAYLGMAAGTLGVISVLGSLVVDTADVAVILASILTTVWVLLVGFKLLGTATRPAVVMDERPAT